MRIIKNFLFFAAFIAMLLTFSSCVLFLTPLLASSYTAPLETTFDPDLPPEQSAKVLFWYLDVVEYNGLDVHKEWNGKDLNRSPLVTLPPGKATIGFNGYFSESSRVGYTEYTTRYTVKDCRFDYNFEAGKEYTVMWEYELISGKGFFYYINIYGKIPKKNSEYQKLGNATNGKAFPKKELLASFFIFNNREVLEEIKKSEEIEKSQEK